MPKRTSPTMNLRAATPRALAPIEPQMLTIKAVVDQRTDSNGQTYDSPRVVYDMADMPIPHDTFVTTPLTVSLVLAIKAKDVIEEETAPVVKDKSLPTTFGGRPTEEKRQQLQERQERARQAAAS